MADAVEQVSKRETEILLDLLRGVLDVAGDLVEMGCYRGERSVLFGKLLAEAAPEKGLWLYDSFAGLPERTAEDTGAEAFAKGELLATKREVLTKFKKAGLRAPRVKKAFFEDLAPGDLPEEICFAFLDGDLYRSIKTSLRLVYPRMAKGGVMIVHDYNNLELPGATRATEEFIASANFSDVEFSARETLGILRIL